MSTIPALESDNNVSTNNSNNNSCSTNNDINKTNLIINYLPQTMTDEEFRVLFAKYGDIRSARIIRNKVSGCSYGFGFVEYFKPEEAEQAIQQLNGVVINHKKIKVSYARPSSDNIKNANIYVTNLPQNYTEREVRELFSSCGNIIQCRLLSSRPGTAFILFNLHEEARKAIEDFNRQCIPGSETRIQVKFATNEPNKRVPKEEAGSSVGGISNIELVPRLQKRNPNNTTMKNMFKTKNYHYGGGAGGGGGYPTASNYDNPHMNRMTTGPIRYTSHNNRFNPMSPSQQYHEPSMTADVHTSSMYSADRSSHYHSNMYGGSMDQSSSFMTSSSNNHHNPTAAPHPYYQHHPMNNDNNIGGNTEEHVLFVYNIGPETTEMSLAKLFSYYGTVMRVNVIRKGGSGEGRGYGFVTMKDYTEACSAIASLNGYKYINNKPLQVSFKKD